MSNYDQITEFLDSVMEEFKETARATSAIASRNETIDAHSLNKLVKANARAEAAVTLRNVIAEATDDELASVVKFIQAKASNALRTSGSTHFSVVSFYTDALKVLGSRI